MPANRPAMSLDPQRILSGLAELRERDPGCELFGAEGHKYALNDPLSESAVTRFEQRHAITLPDDYRRFLLELGNGGAGPAYGVFKLGEMDDGWKHRRWKEGDGMIGDLSEPFPHTKRWNKIPKRPRVDDEHPDFERLMEEFDRQYWDTANINGAIPICNLGCCLREWLIVTGNEAGHVWVDERADEGGLFPRSKLGRRRFTFGDWYQNWLTNALRETGRRSKGGGAKSG